MEDVKFKEGQYVTLTQDYESIVKGDSVLILAVRDNVLLVRFLGKSIIVPKEYCK